MENYSKQINAELEYNRRRKRESDPTVPYDITDPKALSHFESVKNKAMLATPPKDEFSWNSEYKADFNTASKDFWRKYAQYGLDYYNSGIMSGTFGSPDADIGSMLSRLHNFIKDSLSKELSDHKQTTEELTICFNAINDVFALLAQMIKRSDMNINIVNIGAYLHGAINAYIETVISAQIRKQQRGTINGG